MPPLKAVLNLHEAATELRLREVCERNDARVFAKVRLADVLPIEGSGIPDREFEFALKSHFDFVIADDVHQPLFAVEFDGPSHQTATQVLRDQMKDGLSERFGLPILRINSNYLRTKYRNMDLLSWFVEVWFASRWFERAQESGQVPSDEPFMPMAFASIPGREGRFPLWLSGPIRNKIQKHFLEGRVLDMVPSTYIGRNSEGTYRALAFLRVNDTLGVAAETAMRFQRFPVSQAEALDDVVLFDLFDRLEAVLDGREAASTMADIAVRLAEIRASCKPRFLVNINLQE